MEPRSGSTPSVDLLDLVEPELDRDLALERGIHGITGATLTARAVTQAVRRTLAIHAAVGSGAP